MLNKLCYNILISKWSAEITDKVVKKINYRLNQIELDILSLLNEDGADTQWYIGNYTESKIAEKIGADTLIHPHINRLLNFKMISKKTFDQTGDTSYKITISGKNYLEFASEDKKNKILWGIYIPLGVSLGTNFLIYIIGKLF